MFFILRKVRFLSFLSSIPAVILFWLFAFLLYQATSLRSRSSLPEVESRAATKPLPLSARNQGAAHIRLGDLESWLQRHPQCQIISLTTDGSYYTISFEDQRSHVSDFKNP